VPSVRRRAGLYTGGEGAGAGPYRAALAGFLAHYDEYLPAVAPHGGLPAAGAVGGLPHAAGHSSGKPGNDTVSMVMATGSGMVNGLPIGLAVSTR